jgi:hypothetical protein
MPAHPGLNPLAERKRRLVEQAQLHRSALLFEQLQFRDRIAAASAQVQSQRWWFIGGATLAGWLLARRFGGVARWLPLALSVARIAQGLRK